MFEKTYEMICPNCKKTNKVSVRLNENFNGKEEVHCGFCGEKITEMPAAEPPKVKCEE
ncbi:MAG: hypothetical protein IJ846_00875 [Alphaproteobacteria bacterium]|nr:hypothetical protein [Alphaproteobacteria bacterium]